MIAINVIMPVFNGAKYVREAIQSISRQEFKEFELLVIDDYSTDNGKEIVKTLMERDRRIRLLSNSAQKGLVGALNTGLEHTFGKYIARARADDISRPMRLRLQFEFLESRPEIYLLGGGYKVFDDSGNRKQVFHPSDNVEIAWRQISDTQFCHPSVMFRREMSETLGEYPQQEAEDFAFFSKVVHKYPCANLNRTLI